MPGETMRWHSHYPFNVDPGRLKAKHAGQSQLAACSLKRDKPA